MNIDTLTNDINSFTTSTVTYEQQLEDGFAEANNINYAIEIALYVFFSFLLLLGILGITSVCCVFYCNSYKCNCLTYAWCGIYSILGILMFVTAGLFLSGSIFIYDTCSAYPYYFKNQTNFKSLTFANDQVGEIFDTCFYKNSSSMFTAFEDSTVLTNFTTLRTQYTNAIPSSDFYSVVTSIENTLNNYNYNPGTVKIADFNNTTPPQPSAALSQSNVFANFSATGSTQTCNVTKDKLVFNVDDCFPYLTDQVNLYFNSRLQDKTHV